MARDGLSSALLIARESFRSFAANRGLQSAATLAFYGFLSLMPLLLLVIFLFARVLDSSDAALAGVREVTGALFPAFNDEILDDLLKLAGQKVWGLVSIIILTWSMTPFAAAMRMAMLQTFKSELRVRFILAKMRDLAAVFALLLLFIALVALRVFFDFSGIHIYLVKNVSPLVMSMVVLTFFYAVFAPTGTKFLHLLAGAIPAALLLAVMRPLFELMLRFNPNYGYAFGSLKTIFLLQMWVYYTFAVILLGAEIMANTSRRDSLILRGFFTGAASGPARLVNQFVRAVAEGERIFAEGDVGAEMFYVQSGAVSLTRDGHELKRAGPGEYFGEMTMLLNAPRSATATVAAPDTQIVAISQENFDTILRENPKIVRSILKEMATRLKTTNDQLVHRP